ncbi:PP2C family protein-serine/threonine phosphatase [Streptomyces sp. NPDC046182]|uniref:PP2C family protein-serine/threonine phosphatase n=1 Tax=Streptomyces sp. NPDC046182 TaxID=3154601 RepID=UPI0033E43A76
MSTARAASDVGDEVLADVLERSHSASAAEVPGLIDEAARRLGAAGARLYVSDLQQVWLARLPLASERSRSGALGYTLSEPGGGVEGGRLEVDSSLAGLAYRTQKTQLTIDAGTAWIPMVDGIERVGVMEVSSPAPGTHGMYRALASLATLLVVSKAGHSDLLVERERSRPMTLQAELLWAFLPPRTVGTSRATSAAVLEPAYEVGGDAFDHNFTEDRLHLTLLDAMGHDLASGGASAVGLAVCRSTRRAGGGLRDIASAIDRTLAQWIPERLMTGIVANLDTIRGELTWINCGHPPPLLIRDGRVLSKALERPADLPFGFGFHTDHPPRQHREPLQPGDRVLFYSDGVTEARSSSGELFGESRLADAVIRSMASGDAAPEALRRLILHLLLHQDQRLTDDATILLAEWHPPTPVRPHV